MKEFLSTVMILFVFITGLYAQTSQRGFSFQGYAIDKEGKAMSQEDITVKFTIYPKGGSGLRVTYTENVSVTTDDFGVFHTEVGAETPSEFQEMNFTANGVIYWLKVEVKKTVSGTFTTINDSQMLAVPYARFADNGVPVGTIVPFAGPENKIPAGWKNCDGSLLDENEYSQLYAVLGKAWGGNTNNFNLPDLRGRFLRGVDDASGNDPNASSRTAINSGGNEGDKVGSVQEEGFKSHNHTGTTETDGAHKHTGHTTKRADNYDNDRPHNFLTYADPKNEDPYYTETDLAINNTGSDHDHKLKVDDTGDNETRPINAAVYYIIKY
jgi:microcystin-dependent protein